jgi:uncharacterized membrane protein YeaQ/YmgE (transglycosylase-associated protein family)
MSDLGTVLAIMISAFVTGGLARLAVPGPDPMPAWLTVSIGLVGSVAGGAIAVALFGRNASVVGICSFVLAVLLVIGYRILIQKRAIVGIEALRFPRRGFGVSRYRARLQQRGVDPDVLLDRALERREAERRDGDDPPEDEQS